MHKWMLDVKVIPVMEDGDLLLNAILAVCLLVLVGVVPVRGDRNGGEIDLGRFASWCLNKSRCHNCWRMGIRGT